MSENKMKRKRPSDQKTRSKRRKANREKHTRKLERTPKWEEYRQNTVKGTRKRTRKDININTQIQKRKYLGSQIEVSTSLFDIKIVYTAVTVPRRQNLM